MKTKLPAEIRKSEGELWATQIAQCVVGTFIMQAPPGDIVLNRAPKS